MGKLGLLDVAIGDYGTEEAAMARYRAEGTERALTLGNRGPIRYTADGGVDPAIVDAYKEHGFYVFTGVLGPDELADLERDITDMVDRFPVTKGADVDRHGRPALGSDGTARNINWVRPLSDPLGGTAYAHGRHQVKMFEPVAPDGAPEWIVQVVLGSLQYADACLRTYGHPDLLAVAAAINGDDFVPFNEAVWIKAPGLGGSVAWHQDGWTHWDSPILDWGSHGFNMMGQLYGCDAANGLWVLPGSHVMGRIDIKAMVAACGSERLPDAVPLICAPGDVGITNRQCLHGSFANTTPNPRVTINMGFHRRADVLGVEGGGVHNAVSVYDAERIRRRSEIIMYAIDARTQRFPNERRFAYEPFAGHESEYRWGTDTARAALHDYNQDDLGI